MAFHRELVARDGAGRRQLHVAEIRRLAGSGMRLGNMQT